MSGASWKIWGITYLVTQTNYIVHISVAPYHVSVPFEVRVVLNFQFYFIIIAGKWEVSSCLPLHIPVPVLCLLLLDETTESTAGGDRIAQAIRYMNRHLFEPIGVQDAAAAVSLSPSHFSRQFKARTGYSPYEYIVLRRIDKAKYMLASTELSVKEIAYATGYNSEENFIHSFRKNVGVAPGIFRKYPV